MLILVLLIYLYLEFIYRSNNKLPYKFIHKIKYINNIPNIIYRTYNRRYICDKMYNKCHKLWEQLNPDYNIIWYLCNNKSNSFIDSLDIRIKNAYYNLKPGAFKSDLLRLCLLYNTGGVYVDSYTVPYISIKNILKGLSNFEFISVLDPKQSNYGIHNGFIIVTPKHPFIYTAIWNIVKNVEEKNYTDCVLGVTGPICLKRSIQQVLNTSDNFQIGKNNYIHPFYLFKFEYGLGQYIYKNNICLMSKKYDILSYFYSKILCYNKSYTYLWRTKDIFYK